MTEDPIHQIHSTESFSLCMLSHVGCVRTENQDNLGRASVLTRELIIVCDGMGGHKGGSISSQIAVETMIATFEQYADQFQNNGDLLYTCIDQANSAIYGYAEQNPDLMGMGTTVVAFIIENNIVTMAHIGDSRAYFFRGNALNLLTFDHSQVFLGVKNGFMTFEEAEVSDTNNLLLAALGIEPELPFSQEEFVQTIPFLLSQGDKILLCSDGLTGINNFSENHLITLMQSDIHINAQTNQILQYALDNTADDNVTVSVLEYTAPNPAAGSTVLPVDVRDEFRVQPDSPSPTPERKKTVVAPASIPVTPDGIQPASSKPSSPAMMYGIGAVVVVALLLMFNIFSGDDPPKKVPPRTQTTQTTQQSGSEVESSGNTDENSSAEDTEESVEVKDPKITGSNNKQTGQERTKTNEKTSIGIDIKVRKRNKTRNKPRSQNPNTNTSAESTPQNNGPTAEEQRAAEEARQKQIREDRIVKNVNQYVAIAHPKMRANIHKCGKLSRPKYCHGTIGKQRPTYEGMRGVYDDLGMLRTFTTYYDDNKPPNKEEEAEIFRRTHIALQSHSKQLHETQKAAEEDKKNPDSENK